MSSPFSSQLSVGNHVKLGVKDPSGTITGVVEGSDAFGTVILSKAVTTLAPLTEEELAKKRAQEEEDGLEPGESNNNAAENEEGEKPKLQMIMANRIQDVELLKIPKTGSKKVRTVFTDALPRKRVFVLDVDTLLGRAICSKFGAAHDWEIVGTVTPGCSFSLSENNSSQQQQQQQQNQNNNNETKNNNNDHPHPALPAGVSCIVPTFREDPVNFKLAILKSDVIVCPLRDDTYCAQAALRILSNTDFEDEKVFILVSSVLTWSKTADALKAKAEADRKEEQEAIRKEKIEAGEDPDDEEEEDAEGGGPGGAGGEGGVGEEEFEEPPPVFGDSNDHERVPHPRYQHWRLLEQATKFANSESLHTYVLTAGMLYGDGEECLHDLFSAAWHRVPLPVLVKKTPEQVGEEAKKKKKRLLLEAQQQEGSGLAGPQEVTVSPYLHNNVIPAIHVRDLATGIFNASNAEEVQGNRYMLAVDNGNCAFNEIIGALTKTMGDPAEEPKLVKEPIGAASRWFDIMTVDLHLEAQNFGMLVGDDDEWVSQGGLIENMLKIANEFRKVHELTPIRVAVVGPPESGKTQLAKWVSDKYGLEWINIPSIISYYKEHRDRIYKALLARREERRIEKQRRDEAEAAERVEEGGSSVSGGTGTESGLGIGTKPSTRKQQQQQQLDEDDEDYVSEDEWEVKFSVPTPPNSNSRLTARSGGGDSEVVSDEELSRPPSSRGTGSQLQQHADLQKKNIEPEVEAAEDKDEDDEGGEDEVLYQLKEDLRLCNKVWALKTMQTTPTTAADQTPHQSERFIDHALAVMARFKLQNSAQGKNQGYVLDGYPRTTRQAALTFSADSENVIGTLPEWEEVDEGDEEQGIPPTKKLPDEAVQPLDPQDDAENFASLLDTVDPDLLMEHAIVLDASDNVILSRASDMGSNRAKRIERLHRRMQFNQLYNSRSGKPVFSVQSWLRAILTGSDNAPSRSVAIMTLDTDVAWPVTGHAATSQVDAFLGKPHVIHPTAKELEDEARSAEEQHASEVAAKIESNAIEKQRLQEEEARRSAVAASHARRLATTADEGKAASAVCSIPAQAYLTNYIAAPLASCVSSVARVRPNDPLGVLADKLYQYDAPIVHAKEILTGSSSSSSSSSPSSSATSAASSRNNNTPRGNTST